MAEEWLESRRRQGAADMHTGFYFGTFPAAFVDCAVGTHYGWRAVFAVGGTAAMLVAFTPWPPEQDRGEYRGKAVAFANAFVGFLAAGVTFVLGVEAARMHTIGSSIALRAVAFRLGIAVLPLTVETAGKELPF